MTSEPMLLEPEVEALLREVAADPRSALLRVPRAKAVPTLYEDRPAAGPATAGLSAAEREILRVHSLEVAWLLRQVCLVRLMEGRRNRSYVCHYLTTRKRVELIPPLELTERSRTAADELAEDDSHAPTLRLLERAVGDLNGDEPTILELAAAAHRLQPSNEARMFASLDLALGQFPRSALAVLKAVLGSYPSRAIGARAWGTVGFANSRLGELGRAHRGYQMASASENDVPSFWMDRLAFAIQVGEASDAVGASRHLDQMMTADHEEVNWFVDSRIRRRRTGEWKPTVEASRLIAPLRDQLGIVGRRIVDVFA